MIEWLKVKDVVDLSWEIQRFRKLKITLIEIEREQIDAGIKWDREHPDEPDYDWFKQMSEDVQTTLRDNLGGIEHDP
jgi:hypothetical protein